MDSIYFKFWRNFQISAESKYKNENFASSYRPSLEVNITLS